MLFDGRLGVVGVASMECLPAASTRGVAASGRVAACPEPGDRAGYAATGFIVCREVRLVVLDLESCRAWGEDRWRGGRSPRPNMIGSPRPCAVKTVQPRRPARSGSQPSDDRYEPGEGEDAGRRRAIAARSPSARTDHRAHRAAEHVRLGPDAGAAPLLVVELGCCRRRSGRSRIRAADPRDDVPAVARRAGVGRVARAARRRASPPLRAPACLLEREQVRGRRPAAVVEGHEQALRSRPSASRSLKASRCSTAGEPARARRWPSRPSSGRCPSVARARDSARPDRAHAVPNRPRGAADAYVSPDRKDVVRDMVSAEDAPQGSGLRIASSSLTGPRVRRRCCSPSPRAWPLATRRSRRTACASSWSRRRPHSWIDQALDVRGGAPGRRASSPSSRKARPMGETAAAAVRRGASTVGGCPTRHRGAAPAQRGARRAASGRRSRRRAARTPPAAPRCPSCGRSPGPPRSPSARGRLVERLVGRLSTGWPFSP